MTWMEARLLHWAESVWQTPETSLQKSYCWDFPSGPVVKNLPANEGDLGLIPIPGRSHILQNSSASAPQQLKPTRPRAHALQEKPLHWEARAPQDEEEPLLATTREKPAKPWKPSAAKNNK